MEKQSKKEQLAEFENLRKEIYESNDYISNYLSQQIEELKKKDEEEILRKEEEIIKKAKQDSCGFSKNTNFSNLNSLATKKSTEKSKPSFYSTGNFNCFDLSSLLTEEEDLSDNICSATKEFKTKERQTSSSDEEYEIDI